MRRAAILPVLLSALFMPMGVGALALAVSTPAVAQDCVAPVVARVSGHSMASVAPDGHRLILRALCGDDLRRGDLVAFSAPGLPIKTVVAVAGDTVDHASGVVVVNGQPALSAAGHPLRIFAPNASDEDRQRQRLMRHVRGIVPAGHVVVAGDPAPGRHLDSASPGHYGRVSLADIVGVAKTYKRTAGL